MSYKRRSFLKKSSQVGTGLVLAPWLLNGCGSESDPKKGKEEEESKPIEMFFKISLAEWSLHKAILRKKELDHLDFPIIAKKEFGLDAIEYVNQMFFDKAEDQSYLMEMKQRADDHGVKSLLIMCDREGHLGDTDEKKRIQAVENHYKWVEAAAFLGCHSIRVNAAGEGSYEEVRDAASDGLGRLSEFAKTHNLNVIVENHGGYSSDGKWLSTVMQNVGMDNCGTLPDFGNFCIERSEDGCKEEYDRYMGVTELMPFAKAVSAKTLGFDKKGNDRLTDYTKMMKIVKKAGYKGYVGIEYEGDDMSEMDGIKASIALLKRVGEELG